MKRYRCANFALFCITIVYSFTYSSFFLNAQQDWTEDMRLTYRQGYSYDPRAACNGDTIHLVWWEGYVDTMIHEEVFYKRSTDAGEAWGEDVLLTPEDDITAVMPRVAVWGNDVHTVWKEQGAYYLTICYRKSSDGGGSWGTIDTILKTNLDGWYHPWITARENYVYIVAIKSGGGGRLVFVRSTDSGNSWLAPETITYATSLPRIERSIFDSLFLAVAYVNGSISDIYSVRSLDMGTTWCDSQIISDYDGIASQRPAMSLDDSSGIHITWYDYKFSPYPWTGDIFCRTSRDLGITWEAIDSLTVMHRAVASDILTERNNLHLVWEDDRNGFNDNFEIYYRMSTDLGQHWGVEQRLTDAVNWSRRPALACDGQYLHLFWFDLRDDPSNIVGEIYYKRKDLSSGIVTEGKSSILLGTSTDVFPNPFTTVVRLQITDDRYEGVASIRLYDVSGKEVLVYEVTDRAKQIILDTRDLPCGVYFLALEAASCSGLKKVIKVE